MSLTGEDDWRLSGLAQLQVPSLKLHERKAQAHEVKWSGEVSYCTLGRANVEH